MILEAAPDLGTQVSRLRHTLARWSLSDAGAHAEIRRGRPGDLGTPALWRLLVTCDIDPQGEAATAGWALLAWALATLGGPESRQSLGQVLHASGLSELRLVRLLRADRSQLTDALRAGIRQVTAKRGNADALQLARLLLTDPDGEAGEQIRRQIARDYYRAALKPQKEV